MKTENISAWPTRLFSISLAGMGFLISLYLATYELGKFSTVWEPLFGKGSEVVLHSWLASTLPLPDALIGSFGYLFEIIAIAFGGADRWEKIPWIVYLYAGVACAMGLTGLILAGVQGLILHAYCSLCLCSALISVILTVPALRELAGTLHEKRKKNAKHYFTPKHQLRHFRRRWGH